MKNFLLGSLAVVLVVVSCVMQVTLMPRINIFGSYPEISLVVVIALGMLMRPALGTLVGF